VEEAARYAASDLRGIRITKKARGFSEKWMRRIVGGQFIFGNEGKPLYVPGPYDGGAKAERILSTLRAKLGDDGFHYVIPVELEEDEDEAEDDIGILAMDSEAGAGDPDQALVTLAENFLDQNEGFDRIEYGGKTGAQQAADLLKQALRMQQEIAAAGGGLEMNLEDAIRILQTLWNLRALPEEDRAEALHAMPEPMAGYLKDAVEQAGGTMPEDERLILDFLLLNADAPWRVAAAHAHRIFLSYWQKQGATPIILTGQDTKESAIEAVIRRRKLFLVILEVVIE